MPPQPEEKREGKDNGDIEAVRITVTSKWNANIQREKGGERERARTQLYHRFQGHILYCLFLRVAAETRAL